jgi:biopolymer transport protein ExbB
MKRIIIGFCSLAFGLSVASVAAQPKTLDELLNVVKNGAISESAEYRKREQEFLNAKQDQQQLLNQANAQRAAEERRSEELEEVYNRQEEELAQLTELRDKRMGSLRELFGQLMQTAGDVRGKFETSIISAQHPGRGTFLAELARKMGAQAELATVEEIEQVFFEILREMTESGKVVKFKADVVKPDGNKVNEDVVRVGSFNLIADGKYLQYDGKENFLSELLRQPQGHFVDTADDLNTAELDPEDPYVPFALDPSGGSVLSILIQAPGFGERIDQGGLVGYVTMFLGLIGVLIAVWKWLKIGDMNRRVQQQISSKSASADNPLGRVLMVYEKNKNVDTETLELKLNEAILKETPEIIDWVGLLKVVAILAPLLGLLGTVTGMIQTFQAITMFGAGDPKLMAGGISQALVTTVQGLCVAIPMTLLHSIVNTRSRSLIHVLEEQSAGIIASHNEKAKR